MEEKCPKCGCISSQFKFYDSEDKIKIVTNNCGWCNTPLEEFNDKIKEKIKMKKVVLGILLLVSLSGCGLFERFTAKVIGSSKMCVDGVEYIQFTSGASVAYTPEGRIKTCR